MGGYNAKIYAQKTIGMSMDWMDCQSSKGMPAEDRRFECSRGKKAFMLLCNFLVKTAKPLETLPKGGRKKTTKVYF